MKWNDEQRKAIEIRGSDILVAAGAGSGKTAVLVERILKRILPDNGEKPLDVDRLVVVTFTKAAAGEMRQRLFDSLRAKLENASGDEYRRIYEQQKKLSKARISTIHSFCHSVINENASESGMDSSYRLLSDSTPDQMKSDIADDVLEEMSRNNREVYLRLADIYGTWKNDSGLKKTLLDIVSFAYNFADPVAKIREFQDAYKAFPDNDFAKSLWGIYLRKYIKKNCEYIMNRFERLRDMAEETGYEKCAGILERDIDMLNNAFSVLSDDSASWDEITQISQKVQFERISADKNRDDLKDIYEYVKSERDILKKKIKDQIAAKYLSYTQNDFEEEREAVYPDIAALSDAATAIIVQYSEQKKNKKVLDFSDLEHIALKLLSDETVAAKYRSQIDEIYIDEYQDTNEVQNLILKLVSGGRGGIGNRFMVGDVKQSIYSFRQARPDIFTDKYNRYSDGNGGQLVRLNRNYRCRSEVIDFTNSVFRKIMNRNTCEMDYGVNEMLICGAAGEYLPPESDAYNYDCEVICALGSNSEEARAEEAIAVAEKINEIISSGMTVGKITEDRDDRRPVTYGDICILFRSGTHAVSNLLTVLPKYGIPVSYENSGNLYDCPEFAVIMSFLRVLDNPMQDIYLISVLKNIYGFSENLLSEIRLSYGNGDSCYYDAFDSSERPECISVRNRINDLRLRARSASVSETVWNCMHENGFYDRLSAVSGGEAAKQNLMQLFGIAASSDEHDNSDLSGFIRHIDSIINMKGKLPGIPLKAGNSVKIMTIHGSKGLEFPVVIIFGTGNERNDRDEKQTFVCSRSLGFGAPCYDSVRKICGPSIMKLLVSSRMSEESKAEEMRILYVAMTRAREKLIISGHISRGITAAQYTDYIGSMNDGRGNIYDYSVSSAEKNIDLICASVMSEGNGDMITFTDHRDRQNGQDTEEEQKPSFASLPAMPLYNAAPGELFMRLGNTSSDEAPSKISVSEIRRMTNFAEDGIARNAAGTSEEITLSSADGATDSGLSAAKKGTLLHLAIEHMDFGKISCEGYADELIMSLEDNGFITEDEARLIPAGILGKFMRSDFAGRIAEADRVLREVPFTVTADYSRFGIAKNGSVAVQGIIDCVLFEHGNIILVDFKSDSVYDNYAEYSEKYSVQLEIYAEALEKAFGKKPDETYLYYLKNNHLEKM